MNQSICTFLAQATIANPAETVSARVLYDRFLLWLEPAQRHDWTKTQFLIGIARAGYEIGRDHSRNLRIAGLGWRDKSRPAWTVRPDGRLKLSSAT